MMKKIVGFVSVIFVSGLFTLSSFSSESQEALLGCSSSTATIELIPGQATSCLELAKLLKSVPIEGTAADQWSFRGEAKTRKEIENIIGQSLPADLIPWGYVLHQDKSGNQSLVVLDANYWRAAPDHQEHADNPVSARKGYLFMALQWEQKNKAPIQNSVEFGAAFKEFNSYNRAFFYFKPKAGLFHFLKSTKLNGDVYSRFALKEAKKRSYHCNACTGWLCNQEKVACYHSGKGNADDIHLLQNESEGYTLKNFEVNQDHLTESEETK